LPNDAAGTGVSELAFSPDGTILAATGSYLYVWDVATRRLTASLSDPGSGQVFAAALSPDGKILATGGPGTTVYLWNVG
jgi:WD40 repeat protein